MDLIIEISLLAAPGSTNAVVRRVDAGQDKWTFATERPDAELFYRTKQVGDFVLSGADCDWLYAHWQLYDCCIDINVNVFTPACDAGGEDDFFWPGYFPLNAVRWDFAACTATVRDVLPRDAYDALYRVWENPINLLAITGVAPIFQPTVGVYLNYRPYQTNENGDYVPTFPDGNIMGIGPSGNEHYYLRAMPLVPALNKLLYDTTLGTPSARLGSSAGLQSEFYTAAVNPVTRRPNLTKIIMAGSDAKRPASEQFATSLTVSLKELVMELRGLHNVYYLIDPVSGRFRLEHYSWFAEQSYSPTGQVSINLLRFTDALATANNESVDLEKSFGVEELIIANNGGSEFKEFGRGSVRYDSDCVAKNDKGETQTSTITVSRLFTDLMAAYMKPDSVPDDAIFLAETQPSGFDSSLGSTLPSFAQAYETISYEDYTQTVGLGINGYQSAAMLFIDYHRHGRSFTAGVVNAIKLADGSYAEGVRMSMLSTKAIRRQENIVIPLCCIDLPLNLKGYLKTNRFAACLLDKGVFDPAKETFTLDVLADSRCQKLVVDPPDPQGECAPPGLFLSSRAETEYCYDGVTIMAIYNITVYTDGNCGKYEEKQSVVGAGNCQ